MQKNTEQGEGTLRGSACNVLTTYVTTTYSWNWYYGLGGKKMLVSSIVQIFGAVLCTL